MPTHPITITPAPAALHVSGTLHSLADQLRAGRITSSDALAEAHRALTAPVRTVAAPSPSAQVVPGRRFATLDETIEALESLVTEMDAWLATI